MQNNKPVQKVKKPPRCFFNSGSYDISHIEREPSAPTIKDPPGSFEEAKDVVIAPKKHAGFDLLPTEIPTTVSRHIHTSSESVTPKTGGIMTHPSVQKSLPRIPTPRPPSPKRCTIL